MHVSGSSGFKTGRPYSQPSLRRICAVDVVRLQDYLVSSLCHAAHPVDLMVGGVGAVELGWYVPGCLDALLPPAAAVVADALLHTV